MIKKGMLHKRKGQAIDRAASEIEAAVSAKTAEHKIIKVALAHIDLWADQPRTFHLTLEDVYQGVINEDDPKRLEKEDELEGIIGLAVSTTIHGIVNPPVAYQKPGQRVELIGGQRRTMAAIFAALHMGMQEGEPVVTINSDPDHSILETEKIDVKVYARKPDEETLEKLALIDNTQRVQLSMQDKMRAALVLAKGVEAKGEDIKHTMLIDALGVSRAQAFYWQKVMKNRDAKWVKETLDMLMKGKASFTQLRKMAEASPGDRKALFEKWFKSPSVDSGKVSLGTSTSLPAIQKLVMMNVDEAGRSDFEQYDWNDPRQVKAAFSKFLEYWEQQYG